MHVNFESDEDGSNADSFVGSYADGAGFDECHTSVRVGIFSRSYMSKIVAK